MPAQAASRPGRWRAPLLVLAAITVVLAVLAGLVVQRAASAAPSSRMAVASLPATLTVPGTPPALPWPDGVHAALEVPGIGRLPGRASDVPVPIASVAKVMTAVVVLRARPLGAQEAGPQIPVTDADVADYRKRVGTGESLLPLSPGQVLTQRQALEALLVPSANDVATMLARWVSGSVPAFVTAMNDTARAMGMRSTRYTDPSGLDPSTVSSADDQVLLAGQALALPALADVVAKPAADLPGLGRVRNYNALLGELGVVGVKTGSTRAAAGNLVFAARRMVAGREVTFLGAVFSAGAGRAPLAALDQAIAVSRTALAAAQEAVRPVVAVPAGEQVGTLPVDWDRPVPLRTEQPVTVLGWPGLPLRSQLDGTPLPPGPPGRPAGRLVVTVVGSSQPPAVAAVVAVAGVPPPSLWWSVQRQLIPG